MRAPSTNPHANRFAVLSSSSCAVFIAGKGWECCRVCGAILTSLCTGLCEHLLAAFPWSHTRGTLAGRQGRTGSGQGMIWFGFGHGSQFSGGAGHCPCSCSHSPGLFSAWEAGNVCCVPYAVFQREVVHGRATSFVTVVALNRK